MTALMRQLRRSKVGSAHVADGATPAMTPKPGIAARPPALVRRSARGSQAPSSVFTVVSAGAVVRTRFLVVDHEQKQASAWQIALRPFTSVRVATLSDARAALDAGGIVGIVLDEAPGGECALALLDELRDRGDRTPVLVLARCGDPLLSNRCHLRGADCVGKAGAGPNVRAFAHEVTREVTDDDLRDAAATFSRQYGVTAAEELALRTVTRVSGYDAAGEELGISGRTVEKHIDRIRAKSGHASREELVIAVLGIARRRQ